MFWGLTESLWVTIRVSARKPVFSDYGKVYHINDTVFVNVGFVVNLMLTLNQDTVGSLNRSFVRWWVI